MPRLRFLTPFLIVAAVVGLTAGLGIGARGQVNDPRRTTTTTSSTVLSTSTSSPVPTTTTTTAPGDDDGDDPPPPPPSDGESPPAGDDGPLVGGAPRIIPPEYQQIINGVKRSKANNTSALIAALQPLTDYGVPPEEAALVGFGRFPVAGQASFVDDWWFPRFTPSFHLHEGTDIFAAMGTPVRAPADGVFRQSSGPVGGLAAYVTQPDGTYYYMAHLSAFPVDLPSDSPVKTGQVVGFVGDSGNARGGTPHLHFEIHPKGGGPVNPKPYLDVWISEAIANAPRIIDAYAANRPRAIVATGVTRQLASGQGSAFAAPVRPPRSQLLWASSTNPAGGALALADAEAAAVARSLDWSVEAERNAARATQWRRADTAARAVVARLTPLALHGAMGLSPPPQPGS